MARLYSSLTPFLLQLAIEYDLSPMVLCIVPSFISIPFVFLMPDKWMDDFKKDK